MSCAPAWQGREDFGYNMTLFLLGFFCPLAVISLTGLRILFLVRRHLAAMRQSQLGESAKKKEEKLSEMVRPVPDRKIQSGQTVVFSRLSSW